MPIIRNPFRKQDEHLKPITIEKPVDGSKPIEVKEPTEYKLSGMDISRAHCDLYGHKLT